ncbi:MAG: hypothetical protein KDC32_00920, partial [Saprospiraceae bacterium]|nr:hypothetical protein [Saprospiraceae bacterium]
MRYLKKFLIIVVSVLFTLNLSAQSTPEADEDAFFIRKIFDTALTQGSCYDWLDYLTSRIGGRLSGSPQAAAAVEYTRQMLDSLQLDTVWLQ